MRPEREASALLPSWDSRFSLRVMLLTAVDPTHCTYCAPWALQAWIWVPGPPLLTVWSWAAS